MMNLLSLMTALASNMESWTGQPGHTMGLEWLGFYGDTLAVLLAGLRAVIRAGLLAALRDGQRPALCVGPTQAPPCRWTFRPADGRRRYILTDIEAQGPGSLQPESAEDTSWRQWLMYTPGVRIFLWRWRFCYGDGNGCPK
jgi:hypothetical protein